MNALIENIKDTLIAANAALNHLTPEQKAILHKLNRWTLLAVGVLSFGAGYMLG